MVGVYVDRAMVEPETGREDVEQFHPFHLSSAPSAGGTGDTTKSGKYL